MGRDGRVCYVLQRTPRVGWEMEFLHKAFISTYNTTSSLPRVSGCLLSARQGSNS